jgi:hypothetical protein
LDTSKPIIDLKNLLDLSIGNGTPLQVLDVLEEMPKLKRLYLGRRKVLTDAELERLKKRNPDLNINWKW